MLTENNEILKIYKKEKALLEGHFILSSGKRSSAYLQSAIVLSIPEHLNKIALALVKNVKKIIEIDKINLVVSPAMGGVVIGSKIGEILNKKAIFFVISADITKKIAFLFKISPILLPITTPPIAGETTKFILSISIIFLTFFTNAKAILFRCSGILRTIADCKYAELRFPEDKIKCPSKRAFSFL